MKECVKKLQDPALCYCLSMLQTERKHSVKWLVSRSVSEALHCRVRRRNALVFVPCMYRGADKSLARPTSRCILFDGENISFDASLVLYIYVYIYK